MLFEIGREFVFIFQILLMNHLMHGLDHGVQMCIRDRVIPAQADAHRPLAQPDGVLDKRGLLEVGTGAESWLAPGK